MSGSGNTLTLTLVGDFTLGFAGAKVLYAAASDNNSGSSGWQSAGVFTVGTPVFSVAPAAGQGSTGTFTFTVKDTNGWQDENVADVLLNSGLDGSHACYIAYVAYQQGLALMNDSGPQAPYAGYIQFSGSGGPGSSGTGTGTASNSQCTINGNLSSYSVSDDGNTLTLNVAMTFTAPFAGDRIFYLSAADITLWNSGWQADGSWTVPVQSLVITTSSLPNGEVGVAYNQTLQATGGTGPLTWSLVSGALPGGLSLNAATGLISGTPTGVGSSSFMAQVTDSVGVTATQALSLQVTGPPVITTFGLALRLRFPLLSRLTATCIRFRRPFTVRTDSAGKLA